jgi:hypothetical protein
MLFGLFAMGETFFPKLTVDLVGLDFCQLLCSPFRQSLLAGCEDIHHKSRDAPTAPLLRGLIRVERKT